MGKFHPVMAAYGDVVPHVAVSCLMSAISSWVCLHRSLCPCRWCWHITEHRFSTFQRRRFSFFPGLGAREYGKGRWILFFDSSSSSPLLTVPGSPRCNVFVGMVPFRPKRESLLMDVIPHPLRTPMMSMAVIYHIYKGTSFSSSRYFLPLHLTVMRTVHKNV